MKTTKIAFISDTHNRQHLMDTSVWPEADIIIHSGDFSMRGGTAEVLAFLEWYSALPYKHKIFIAGNHDLSFENNEANVANLLAKYPTLTYLHNSSVEVEGIKIWGSPNTPSFGYGWAFNFHRGFDIRKEWEKIPLDSDIIVTHGPALNHGDKVVRGGHRVGCADLLEKIVSFESQVKIHVCGHIHEGYGITKESEITFINASLLNEFYQYTNQPILIDWEDFKNK